MKIWEVWLEGYRATGEYGEATLHGKFEAETFLEACEKWVNTLPEKEREYFHKERLSFWACRFFDNETDARRFCG